MPDIQPYDNSEESKRKKIREYTLYYLEFYLNPLRKWTKEVTPKQRINKIKHANVNWEVISEHIRGMDYQNFLKTPYWKAIAAHTKFRARYRCQICNASNNLNTHHRNYDIHGSEHAHIHELIAICDYCHNKFHDVLPEKTDDYRPQNDSGPSTKWNLKLVVILAVLSLLFAYFMMGCPTKVPF